MNCPDCDYCVEKRSHRHTYGRFIIYYTNYYCDGSKTWVYDTVIEVRPVLLMDGFVKLDKQRIENLLLLK